MELDPHGEINVKILQELQSIRTTLLELNELMVKLSELTKPDGELAKNKAKALESQKTWRALFDSAGKFGT